MLKLQHAPTFTGKVEIPLPGDKVAHVTCTFKWMHRKDVMTFYRRIHMLALMGKWHMRLAQRIVRALAYVPGLKGWAESRTVTFQDTFDMLSEVIDSWEGVDLPWSREACDLLIAQHPNAGMLFMGAWAKGLAENRLGN